MKPFIKKTKAEKKAKIDEELSSIAVDPGVYLPSSPESIVVDIDYKSGRPLQSHAKAPFMATFKVKAAPLSTNVASSAASSASSTTLEGHKNSTSHEPIVSKSVIFKVGDDCRQDVLALQLIATFKEIYQSIGLDLYLYPYRVVATAPGVSLPYNNLYNFLIYLCY